jgi:mono/diheme cytochrome c family protein
MYQVATFFRLLAGLFCAILFVAASLPTVARGESQADQLERLYREQARPLLAKYCGDCHSGDSAEGGLSFDKFKRARHVLVGRQTWLTVLGKLRVKAMPPEDADQPTAEERKLLMQWIDGALNDIECEQDSEPGHVTIRRLNRVEYRNTIRDLLGVDYEPAAEFPADDIGYGFDNIGDVLSLSPILLERYLEAAEEIVTRAIKTDGLGPPVIVRKQAIGLKGAGSHYGGGRRIIVSTQTAHLNFAVEDGGPYEITIGAFGHQAGPDAVKFGVKFDGEEIKQFEVPATEAEPEIFKLEGRAKKGDHKIEITFLNDYYQPKAKDPKLRGDRNLILTNIEVRGPLDAKIEVPKSHERIFFVQPNDKVSPPDAARRILERLASRAYRRPATRGELDRLLELIKLAQQDNASFEESIQLGLQAILVSPHFLFRIEENPPPGETERNLSDYELATRLSYFLWSSMPDDELFKHALRGTLRKGDNLAQQVRRMLKDSRSKALVDNFAAQWLQLRKFDEMTLSERHFPDFTPQLREDMRRETELFFSEIVRQDRSVLELLSADYTFINERLAKHYGIQDVKGEDFQRVSLAGSPRGGILTQASILTLTSNPTRTSPVKRGRWILENLLGEPPPPPPPDVPDLIEEGEELTGTLREQMEQHRENPNCAVCHAQMDALGFALENFDAVGAWRLFDGKHQIDAAGELPDGEKFQGPAELTRLLQTKRNEQFVRCLSEKLLTYALGRGLEYYDQCTVDRITEVTAMDGYRFSTFVLAITNSEPFQKQGAKRSEDD